MEYKVEELCAYLRASGVSPKSTKLVERLVTRLGWDTFYTAPVAQLNSAYHAERPGSKVGLSSQGVTAVNKARQWMHDKRYNLTVDLENANAEKKRDARLTSWSWRGLSTSTFGASTCSSPLTGVLCRTRTAST